MAIPKKHIGAGAMICAAVVSLFWILAEPRPTIKLPDGSVLQFDAMGKRSWVVCYDGNFGLALRSYLPENWCDKLGFRRNPVVIFLPPQMCSVHYTEIVFAWTGLTNTNSSLQSLDSFRLELVDGNRSYLHDGLMIQGSGPKRFLHAAFNCPTFLSDELILRLASGYGSRENINNWVILGEMRVKNPVPKGKHPILTP